MRLRAASVFQPYRPGSCRIILALAPGLPRIALPPNLVLLVFLPPLIYYAAFGMSWQAFRDNLREISLLAVGMCSVHDDRRCGCRALADRTAVGGGVCAGRYCVAPDVVAPLAIARRLGVPSRITASPGRRGSGQRCDSLGAFKFALTAVLTGLFSLAEATMTFAAIVVSETLWGFTVGWLMLRLRYWASRPRIEVTLSLLTPFLAFWVPHAAGGSGVLATVIAGLYVGAKGIDLDLFEDATPGVFFWEFVTYLVEGAIFLLTGLQTRVVLEG